MGDQFVWYLVSMVTAILGMGAAVLLITVHARVLPALSSLRGLKQKGDEARSMLNESLARRDLAKQEHDQIQTALAKAQYKINYAAELDKKISDSETLLRTKESERKEQQELQAAIVQLREHKDSLTESLDQANLERIKIAGDCEVLRGQTQMLRSENESVQRSLDDAKSELSGTQKRRELAMSGIAELEAKHAAARADADASEKRAAAAQESLRVIETELKNSQEQVRLAQIELSGLKAEYGIIQKQIDAAKADFESRQKSWEEELRRTEERFKKLREDYELELSRIDEDKRKRGISTGKQTDRIADLWVPVIPKAMLQRPMVQRGFSENDALQKVSNHLSNLGLQFSERVIRAFHTSLKIAYDSPLLVLAGISGTGKSLLPKRYAEAMGIQVLSVPVQPRWDSPQDLLGFYNHLQDKYVPTELVRALLQMDRHNSFKNASDNFAPAPDDMLLILLDEMNLARIEYYFSDFLSVLENRRDGRKAELLLDVSNAGGVSDPIHVCVDRNVFFVGTMNEDESTQTLSDKVVDRANVMRFAPPKKFVPTTNKSQTEAAGSPMRLSYSIWEDWIKQSEASSWQGNNDRVDKWIEQLSVALKGIGRPFGHRVHRAMSAYVKQYPNKSEEGLFAAMSDQIEQKILPKLRGIDPNTREAVSAIDAVRRIVNELKDDSLAKAIDEGRSGHDQQFHWSGVDRVLDGAM